MLKKKGGDSDGRGLQNGNKGEKTMAVSTLIRISAVMRARTSATLGTVYEPGIET